MSLQNERSKMFIGAIEQDAEHRRHELEKEIGATNAKELGQARSEALNGQRTTLKARQYEIANEASASVATYREEKRALLGEKRTEKLEEILDSAKKELKEFTATKEYAESILRDVKLISTLCQADDAQFVISNSDEPLSEQIMRAYGHSCTVTMREQIELGGFMFASKEAKIKINNTSETKLESEKDWLLTAFGVEIIL